MGIISGLFKSRDNVLKAVCEECGEEVNLPGLMAFGSLFFLMYNSVHEKRQEKGAYSPSYKSR